MRRLVVAFILAILALPLLATSALGHERRDVGQYTFVVGWLDEPPLAGQLNAIDLTVTETSGDKPVEGVEQTLKAEVFYGGLTTPLAVSFRTIQNDPGHYAADLIPTKAGSYTFHLFGKVGTQNVDERFESGPNRFDDVDSVSTLQYPDAVPAGADLSSRLATLQSAVDQARVLAFAAIVLGLGALGLSVWRRRA